MKKLLVVLLSLAMLSCAFGATAESLFPWAEPIKLTIGLPQSNNVENYQTNYVTQYIKEVTNIDVEYVLYPTSSSDASTKLNLQIAGNETLPDILCFGINRNTAYEWGKDGLLLPLNDWYVEHMDGFKTYCEKVGLNPDTVLLHATSPDGNIYAAPNYSYSYNNTHAVRAWINQNWLDKLGLKVPTTTDELYDVLVAFRDQDPNGNGQNDEIPMAGCTSTWYSNPLDWLQNPFIYCQPQAYYTIEPGLYMPLNQTDGVLDVSYDKDAYRNFLIFANKLISENLLSKLSFTMDGTQWDVMARTTPSYVGLFVLGSCDSILPSVVGDEYVPFTVLTGPEGVQNQSIMPPTGNPFIAVTKYCKNPEAAMALINLLFDEKGTDIALVQRYGEKGVDWRYYDPQIDTTKVSAMEGYTPTCVQLQQQWGKLSNKVLGCYILSYVGDPNWWVSAVEPGTVTAHVRYGQNWKLNIQYGPAYDDIVSDASFGYTDEENETWNDLRSALRAYVKESRTLFALGDMDPANDSDWNAYLQELNNLQYKELLEVNREALARKQAMVAK